MTDPVNREGAKRLIDLAVNPNEKSFVLLSCTGGGDPDPETDIEHFLYAKHDADEHLEASGIPCALVRGT